MKKLSILIIAIFIINIANAQWLQTKGPYEGNITSLAISGSNIFAGTLGGGVFLSPNNGTSWTAVNTGLTDTYISSLAISGSNIFAGTWDSGVFLSTNNGVSWTAVNTGLSSTYVKSLAISGSNIFAGTDGGGVWKRTLVDILGIKENKFNNNISVYPNPAKDNLTIETNTNTKQSLEILNLLGQNVYTATINKKATINTSDFPSGVYILKQYSDNETVVKKFVKE